MKIKTQFLPALVCGLIVAAFPVLHAQDAATSPAPPHHGEKGDRGEGPFEKLFKSLDLTEDQKTKIKPVLEERREKMKALRADTTISDEQKHEKAKEIMQSSNGQIKAILTPDQQAKFEKFIEEMKAQHKKPGKE